MERKIGEIFEFKKDWYQCVEGNDCANCVFIDYCKSHAKEERDDTIGLCVSFDRNDRMHVIFKKLEKVGEPYEFDGHLFQSYRTFEVPIFTENYATVRELGNNSKISIEIKQIKEDMGDLDKIKVRDYTKVEELNVMEEKKLNLKPFDIQKAREGKPVCTRDGRKARIICFDTKGSTHPIVALIEKDEKEVPSLYMLNGKKYEDEEEWKGDLMMLPEKKSGWIIVSKNATIYNNLEDAKKSFDLDKELCICKVEWEE